MLCVRTCDGSWTPRTHLRLTVTLKGVAFNPCDGSGTPDELLSALDNVTCTHSYRRFDGHLTISDAQLSAKGWLASTVTVLAPATQTPVSLGIV